MEIFAGNVNKNEIKDFFFKNIIKKQTELAKEKQRLQEEFSKRETDLKRTYDEVCFFGPIIHFECTTGR